MDSIQTSLRNLNFESLSDEVLVHVFSFLNPKTLLKMQCVCKRFLTVSQEQTLWKRFWIQTKPLFSDEPSNFKESVIQVLQFKKAVTNGIETLKEVQTLTGHVKTVNSVFYSKKTLFSGSADTSIKVWKLNQESLKMECKSTLLEHKDAVLTVFFSDPFLFSGSKDTTIKVWQKNEEGILWRCQQTLSGHSDAVTTVLYADKVLFSGSKDKTIKLWKLNEESKQWVCTQTIAAHSDYVMSLLYSEKTLFSGSGSIDEVNKVWIFNESNQNLEYLQQIPKEIKKGEKAFAASLLFADSKLFIGCGEKITVYKFNATSTTWDSTHVFSNHESLVTGQVYLNGLLLSADAFGTIRTWKFSKKNNTWILPQQRVAESDGATSLFYADGMLFSGLANNTIKIWKAAFHSNKHLKHN